MNSIVVNVRALWSKQQIRILAMVSLLMQMVLIFFAPLRKRSGNKLLLFLLWAVYLVADHVATLALGSIVTYTMDHIGLNSTGQNLVAFWAPFLLLHLGGPDNITSYSVEDNKLWWRHFIGLAVQVSVAFLVLVQSNLKSTMLLMPSILIFIVGTTKFAERTLALRSASMDPIRDPFQNKPDLERNLFADKHDASPNERIRGTSGPDFILGGYNRFSILRDRMLNTFDMSGRQLLLGRKDRAFEVIGIELSFFYDILHTKATLVHSFTGGVVRIATLVSISIALYTFCFSEKPSHDIEDVIITYILLSVALLLEIYSLLLVVALKQTTISLLRLNKMWSKNLAKYIFKGKNYVLNIYRGKRQWWSGHMGQYNLMQSSMKSWVRDTEGKHIIFNVIKNAWDFLFGDEHSARVSVVLEKIIIEYVQNIVAEVLEKKMMEHVQLSVPNVVMEALQKLEEKTRFKMIEREEELEPDFVKAKAIERVQKLVRDAVIDDFYYLPKRFSSSWMTNTLDRYDSHLGKSKDSLEVVSYEECVIAWHMATEMCYFALEDIQCREEFEAIYKVSKYIMHLLLERESMMPPGNAQERMHDTSNQMRSRLAERFAALPAEERRDVKQASHASKWKVASQWLVGEFDKERRSVCPLFYLLWEDLAGTFVWTQWEVIRDAWMEMLMFAALRCSPTEHAKSLSSGGELLTHFWLLWAHDDFMDEIMEILQPKIMQVSADETIDHFRDEYEY